MLDIQSPSAELAGTSSVSSDSDKWKAVIARDESKDGMFVFGVVSTGIYCKPSCPSKHPSVDRVQFYDGANEAESAGFRACKRCHPREAVQGNGVVQRVSQYIDRNLDSKLTLARLSHEAGLSPFYFQRTFKKILGISPRQYVEARRLQRVKGSLRKGETVTRSLYDAGFTSRGRLYQDSAVHLGVNPGQFRRGGKGLAIYYTIIDSPIGRLLVGATANGVCAVCLGASDEAVEHALKQDYHKADLYRDDDQMKQWAEKFAQYFEGKEFARDLPIDVVATAFQWKVWRQIQSIHYGQTSSYSKIARAIGKPQAVRAVANACGNNQVALLIPCHRVLGKNGDLRGYRWGVKRKQALLIMEKQAPK